MPEPLFIIAPPRSFTSVIGGMVGQHPEVYGMPEVNLSHGDTLGEIWNSLTAALNFGTAGLLRLLAELHEGEQSEEAVIRARHWIQRRLHWSTAKVFAHISEAAGGKMLVDKSPRNTMKVDNLRRLHAMFPGASFLHLVRHPRSTGKSTLELLKAYGGDSVSRRSEFDPEQVWLRSQNHIMEFSRDLAVGQYMRIKGEMLLADPMRYLPQICDWLGLSSDPASIEAMLHPEASPFACIGPPSAPFGNDPNFLNAPALDMARLARITEPSLEGDVDWRPGEQFSKPVLRLSRQFGYG